jgi:hypothetical protein
MDRTLEQERASLALKILDSLKSLVTICEAVRFSVGLGKNQLERIERAKKLIREAEGKL